MNRLTKFSLAAVAASLFCSLPAFASNPASDTASNPAYSGGWNGSTNGGTGFGSWSLNSTGDGGSYLGSTALSSDSFGIYSGASGTSDASRQFTGGGLTAGQTFSVSLANTTDIDGEIGLNLLDGATSEITLKFVSGQSSWELNDGGSDFGIGQGYAANTSLAFTFTYLGGESYSYTFGSASGTDYTSTNDISNITGVNIYSNNQGNGDNVGFDHLSIVPEPSTVMMMLSSGLFGSFYLLRRKRK